MGAAAIKTIRPDHPLKNMEDRDEDKELIVMCLQQSRHSGRNSWTQEVNNYNSKKKRSFLTMSGRLQNLQYSKRKGAFSIGTNSVKSGSEPAKTQHADQDESDIAKSSHNFNQPQKGNLDEAFYD
ncbi:hypothetical protein Tco_1485444 [Tanacetum coccineum]